MSFRTSLYVERLSSSTVRRNKMVLPINHKTFYLIFDSYWYLRALRHYSLILIRPTLNFKALYRVIKYLNISVTLKNIIVALQLYSLRKCIINKRIDTLYIDYENQKIDKMIIYYLSDLNIRIIGVQRFLIDRSSFPHLASLKIYNEDLRPDTIFCEGSQVYIDCLNRDLPQNLFFRLETRKHREVESVFISNALNVYVFFGPYLKYNEAILEYLKGIDGDFQLELLAHPLNKPKELIKQFQIFNPKLKMDRIKFNSNSIVLAETNSFLTSLDGKCREIVLFSPKSDPCYPSQFKINIPSYAT